MPKRYPLTTDDAAANVYYDDGEGEKQVPVIGAFEEVSDVIKEVATEYNNDFVIGSPQLDDNGIPLHWARMFFNKGKGAFRAGRVDSTQWDNVNIGANSFAEGNNTIASGSASHAEGQTTIASGVYSHAEGNDTESINVSSHAEGNNTTASGSASHAEGINTIASGSASHAEGNYSTASGDHSHAEGQSTISNGVSSHAEGINAKSYLRAMNSKASGSFSTAGDAQVSNLTDFRQTIDATPTELTLNGATPASENRLILPEYRTWGFKGVLSARQTGGTSGTIGDSHIFKFEGGIKRDGANNTTLIGSPTISTITNDAGAAAWALAITADDTNENLVLTVTGEADKVIHWVAKVELIEVG